MLGWGIRVSYLWAKNHKNSDNGRRCRWWRQRYYPYVTCWLACHAKYQLADFLGEVLLDLSHIQESVITKEWYRITKKSGGNGELLIETQLTAKDKGSEVSRTNDDRSEDSIDLSGNSIVGKLSVLVIEAHGLVKKDLLSKNDPCVQLQFENQEWKSSVKKDTDKPTWKETAVLYVQPLLLTGIYQTLVMLKAKGANLCVGCGTKTVILRMNSSVAQM